MDRSAKKIKSVHLGPETPLRRAVWGARRKLRDLRRGKDAFDTTDKPKHPKTRARAIYRRFDDFTARYLPTIVKSTPKDVALKRIYDTITKDLGYRLIESDEKKPWGAYYRIADEQADRFLKEFFPGLTPLEARLGRKDLILSPKFLVVSPGQRLSWQYHNRRSERWRFFTPGTYYRSHSDELGKKITAAPDEIVQFATGERHRLGAPAGNYTIVAEIWQHTAPDKPSNEKDIVRLQDDYDRHLT